MNDTMTVKEVALALGVDESTVRRHIKTIRENVGVENGKTTYINQVEASEIKKRIERSGRNDLCNVAEVKNVQTDLERKEIVFQAMQIMHEEIEILRAQNLELQPKAALADRVLISRDEISIKDAASVLNVPGIGQNNLFSMLRNLKLLDQKNMPYREYIDRGYFRVIEQPWPGRNGQTHINLKTLVTQKGLEYLSRILSRKEITA
jgi:phage antirepressor YoqD-like protein